MTLAAPLAIAPPAHGAEALEWRVQPWRDDPRRAISAFAAIVALGVLAVRTASSPLVGWALVVALLVSLGPACLPIGCRFDDAGVRRRIGIGWERRAWADIRRARLTDHGLYVSTLAHGGPLEPFRGLYLPFPRDASPEWREELRLRLAAHGH